MISSSSSQKLSELRGGLRKLRALHGTISLLQWDQQTYLPSKGLSARAEQLELLSSIHHKLLTEPNFVGLVNELAIARDLTDDAQVIVRETKKVIDRATRVPVDLVERLARAESSTYERWVNARKLKSFSEVKAALGELLSLRIEYAHALGSGDPYDILLDLYEPEAKSSEISRLFSRVGPVLKDLLVRIRSSKAASVKLPRYSGTFRKDLQVELLNFLAATIGFDLSAGRIDETVHPFCSELSAEDVRLTYRLDEADILLGVMPLLHEAGHGIYEQGFIPDYAATPLAEAVSLGVHESQSLLWEKQVGRSRSFLDYLHGLVLERFPGSMGGIDKDTFYKLANSVNAGLIRVDADEVSYGLHVIIRFELEQQLVRRKLSLNDLPAAWNESYKSYLGLEPDSDLTGVLQDVHWYTGAFGYFPTYLLGAIYAAQLHERFQNLNPSCNTDYRQGNFAGLKRWLNQEIHQFGKRYPAKILIGQACGEEPNADYFLNYLARKYSALYDL